MFDFLKKKEKDPICLCAPVTGETVALENVPDKVFAAKIMGDGIAFSFTGDTVCAPCDGELTLIADTLHAFGMKAKNGAEILVHIGLDTVSLNGEGFQALAAVGEKIKKGTPVIRVDQNLIRGKGIDLVTPMVVTNGEEHPFTVENAGKPVIAGEDTVITFS